MRTASRRARRLGGLLLLAATVLWAFMRRRANAVRWVEPPATTLPSLGAPVGTPAAESVPVEPVPVESVSVESVPVESVPVESVPVESVPEERGTPGELPDDVLATDAGLTEVPEAAPEGSTDTVDEARVAEILAESPDADVVVVDETSYEQAVADAAPDPSAPAEAEAEVIATGPDTAEPSADSTEAGLEAGVPSGAVTDDEPTERDLPAPEFEEEEPSRGVPMPTFSEAPTAEIPAVTDDLRAIRGIGPSMERTLQGIGIVSYRQLALLDGAELERVRGELTDFRGRIEREDWVGQARALYRQKYGRDPS